MYRKIYYAKGTALRMSGCGLRYVWVVRGYGIYVLQSFLQLRHDVTAIYDAFLRHSFNNIVMTTKLALKFRYRHHVPTHRIA